MKKQHRRFVAWACSSAVLISSSGMLSPQLAQASSSKAKQYMDYYVTAISVVYPPAGAVFGAMTKMLEFTGFLGKAEDPVGEAIKNINTRLDEHDRQINKLSTGLKDLRRGVYGEYNWNRFTRLQDSRNDLQAIAETLADQPTETSSKNRLARDARTVAARFLDLEMWKWSDLATKDHSWTNRRNLPMTVQSGDMTEPDFKAMPTLEYYATALVVWAATIEYAAGGDAAAVKRQYGAELKKHIDWLSKRQGWDDQGDEPESLPEHVTFRVVGEYGLSKYPEGGFCYYWDLIRDDMRRTIETREPKRYGQEGNVLCNVPAQVRNLAPQFEREREREYGLEVMANLATLLTNLRDKGTVKGAATTVQPSAPSTPSTPAPGPSEVFTGRHKAVHEETGFRGLIGVGEVQDNVLYGVAQNGDLMWHRHFIDFRSNPPRHSFAPTQLVGIGWKGGYQGAYPAGVRGIYSLADDGTLRFHWHTGVFEGTNQWAPQAHVVGTGWSNNHILPMDHGVVYTISKSGAQGRLRWHRHLNYKTGQGGESAWEKPKDVHQGFAQYLTVFSGGKGVLYALGLDGRLYWYRHKDYLRPVPLPASLPENLPTAIAKTLTAQWNRAWEGPKKVGDGWNKYAKLFSPGDGHIYGITANGDLEYHRHLAWQTGEYRWDDRVDGKIAEGWNGYASAFARTTTSDEDAVELPK